MTPTPGVQVIVDKRGRRMAAFMLAFAAVFCGVPFLFEKHPFDHGMFYAWYGFLLLWSAFWGWFFVRNPRFFLHIRDGTLVWEDEFSRKSSGSADLAAVKRLVMKRELKQDHVWRSFFVVLDGEEWKEISKNCMCDPHKLLSAMKEVNPSIHFEEIKLD